MTTTNESDYDKRKGAKMECNWCDGDTEVEVEVDVSSIVTVHGAIEPVDIQQRVTCPRCVDHPGFEPMPEEDPDLARDIANDVIEQRSHQELFSSAIDSLSGQLRELNACMTACDELGVAPVMWAPYRRYLEQKLKSKLDDNPTVAQEAGHKFFEVAFPAYAPTTVREFSRLRADKRVNGLRAEILSASQKGT